MSLASRLSVDCECDGNPAENGSPLIRRIESRNGLHTLEQAEKIGLLHSA